MSRSRRMLDAQRKRERDELPLEAIDGGLRSTTTSSTASPVKKRLTRDPSLRTPNDADMTSAERADRREQTDTDAAKRRGLPRSVSGTPVRAERRATDGHKSTSASREASSRPSSRSASPPPVCLSSSAAAAVVRPKPLGDTLTAAKSLAGANRQSSQTVAATRSSTGYPAHRLQVVSRDASTDMGERCPDRQPSREPASPLSTPPLLAPAPTPDFEVDRLARPPLPPRTGDTVMEEASQCSAGPSPSSPLTTARPPFRAVVSPGMVPQHLSRAGSRQSTPQLSQVALPTNSPRTYYTPHYAFPALPGHEEEPWSPLPPPSVASWRPKGSLYTPPTPPPPPAQSTDPEEPSGTALATSPRAWSAGDAFPSVPASPLAKAAASNTVQVGGSADLAAASDVAPVAPLSPETLRLCEDWAAPTESVCESDELDEPHLEDRSGFQNRGNDCYACSVLTLLLRNERFRAALLYSPMLIAWRLYHGTALHAASVESGYRTTSQARTKHNQAAQEKAAMDAFEARYGYRLTADDADVLVDEISDHDEEKDVNAEDGPDDVTASHAVHTVHSVLAELISKQQKRELVVRKVNDPDLRLALRRAYLVKFLGIGGPKSERRARIYYQGISLSSLALFFEDEFFMGFQEDAHEFVVALFNKLEAEAVRFEKRRRVLQAVRAQSAGRLGTDAHDEEKTGAHHVESEAEETEDAEKAEPPARASSEPSSTTADDIEAKRAASEAAALTRSVWVNQLLQGRLLSIMRCRHEGCGHEIVTEEPFMNLTLPVTLPAAPQKAVSGDEDTTGKAESSEEEAEDDPDTAERAHANTATAPLSLSHGATVPSVTALLQHTMQYDKLDGYACDACQSSGAQWQGGCFLGSPPPLLLVQLKRFAVTFDKGAVVVTKADQPVKVETHLVVHALLDDRTTEASGAGLMHGEPATPALYNAEDKCFDEALRALERRAGFSATEPLVRAVRTEYRLQGLVLHLGTTLHFGHYVADFAVEPDASVHDTDAKAETHTASGKRGRSDEASGERSCEDGEDASRTSSEGSEESGTRFVWRLANDNRVLQLSQAAMSANLEQNRMCYLLLYEKVSETITECPLWSVIPRDEAV